MTGKDIKAIRTKLKMTQKEFAERLKVDDTVVKQWEHGAQRPSPKMVSRINRLSRKGTK